MKKIIINADDFGISIGTNRGIEKAHRNGILTSVSIMPTGVAFSDAVKVAKRNKKLGIGVHLSLTWGRSILPKKNIPDLVDEDNYFFPSFIRLFVKLIFNRKIIDQISDELQAQVELVKKKGIKVDHLNGQIHIHFIPWIFSKVTSLARKNNISYVRVPLEPLSSIPFSFSFFKWAMLQVLGILVSFVDGLPNNSVTFYGILHTSKMSSKVIKKILMQNNDIAEILSHPGECDLGNNMFDFNRQGVNSFVGSKNRINELNALLSSDLRKFVGDNKLQLVTFSDIQNS